MIWLLFHLQHFTYCFINIYFAFSQSSKPLYFQQYYDFIKGDVAILFYHLSTLCYLIPLSDVCVSDLYTPMFCKIQVEKITLLI
jgi:hypothetical protein